MSALAAKSERKQIFADEIVCDLGMKFWKRREEDQHAGRWH
jgi:hypothetical protein